MRLGHIELFVHDVEQATAFYCDGLGFELTEGIVDKLAWLRLGKTELLLRRGDPGPPPSTYASSRCALVLYCDDLPTLLAELASRGLEPAGYDGSADCPLFGDPDGNWIQIVDPSSH